MKQNFATKLERSLADAEIQVFFLAENLVSNFLA